MVTHGYVSSKFERGLHGMWVVGHATPYATAAATKLLLFPRKLESHEMPLWSSLPPVLGPF